MAGDCETLAKIENIHLNSNSEDIPSVIGVSNGYHILAEHCVSLEQVYITDLAVKKIGGKVRCAVATSKQFSEVYTLDNTQFRQLASLKGHSSSVTNVRFAPETDYLVYSSSLDGKIKLWDLRSGECVKELKDDGLKPLSCMDISSNERILCAGTELIEGDAFLLFWDVRSRQLLGGYWESHTDDITSTAFHPTEQDTVASCSTDGLVNLFDLRESCEDDALQASLNTECSVGKVRWNSDDILSLTTHTETVQLWRRDGAAPEMNFSRSDVSTALNSSPDDSYVIDVHTRLNGEMFLLAGSRAEQGKSLYVMNTNNGKLEMAAPLIGNRQIIRASEYIPKEELIFTGGESGCLCAWKPGYEKATHAQKKTAKNRSKQKHRPY